MASTPHGDDGSPSPLLQTSGSSPRTYRYKRVSISCELLQQLVTQDADSADFPWGARCTQGVPSDARLVHSYVAWAGTAPVLCLIFEHAAWPALAAGERVPDFVPVFASYRQEEPHG